MRRIWIFNEKVFSLENLFAKRFRDFPKNFKALSKAKFLTYPFSGKSFLKKNKKTKKHFIHKKSYPQAVENYVDNFERNIENTDISNKNRVWKTKIYLVENAHEKRKAIF